MGHLWSLATALPPYRIDAAGLKKVGRQLFGEIFTDGFDAFDRIIDNSRIDTRHLCQPVEDLVAPRSLRTTSAWYRDAIRSLGKKALLSAIDRAGIKPREIDALIVCTATGFLIPSLDCYLVNELGLSPATRRLHFATLGCAGGAGGVIRAAETLAGPFWPADKNVTAAVVTVETPTLTFRPGDRSMANAVSSVLFGDGAAAAIMRSKPRPDRPSLRVRGARSFLHKDTYDRMGFKLDNDGFQVVLAPDVPETAVRGLSDNVAALCAQACATPQDLRFFAIHPGGTKVLERVEEALSLPESATRASWDVLRAHGNMSSPTVLFVLREVIERTPPTPGSLGLLAAFGPGLAAELALLEAVVP